jgi:hypothetical protein
MASAEPNVPAVPMGNVQLANVLLAVPALLPDDAELAAATDASPAVCCPDFGQLLA